MLEAELRQCAEAGQDLSRLNEAVRAREAGDADVLLAAMDAMAKGEIVDPPGEPSEIEGIEALAAGAAEPGCMLDEEVLFDRLHGAWLGRCVGCALGKPLEEFMHEAGGLTSRARVRMYVEGTGAGEYPIRDFVRGRSASEARTGKACCPGSTREGIVCMEPDDDMRYTVLATKVLEESGAEFDSWDVARGWMKHLPYMAVCTAETQAYRNLVERFEFHLGSDWSRERQAVDWGWVRTRQNPYREWVGAAIRADAYGYACPGEPKRAARLAWRDARISHTSNGIYGAMFVAGMVAAALVSCEVRSVVGAGLACVPSESRLARAVREAVRACESASDDEAALDEVDRIVAGLDAAHAIVHAVIVAAALVRGRGDVMRVLSIAVGAGRDTDCNGATVGSIVGAMVGVGGVPEHMSRRLGDALETGLGDEGRVSIRAMAKRSLGIIECVRSGGRSGGRASTIGD